MITSFYTRLAIGFLLLQTFIQFNISPALANIPNPPPNTLTAIAVSSSQINLHWNDPTVNETGFWIERSPSGLNGTWIGVDEVKDNVTDFSDKYLLPATTYFYRVCAYNNYGYSSYTNTANATTFNVSSILNCQ